MLQETMMSEIELKGGRSTLGVVRIGHTVRRPVSENSLFVHNLLSELEKEKFYRCPRFLGIDEDGREILNFINGSVPSDLGEFTLEQIRLGASILKELHDVTSKLSLRGGEDVICHGDASPCNYVFQDNIPIALIDFDTAFAGTRNIDIGYGAWLWANLGSHDQTNIETARKLRAFLKGYLEISPYELLHNIEEAHEWLLPRLAQDTQRSTIKWVNDCRKWLCKNKNIILKLLI